MTARTLLLTMISAVLTLASGCPPQQGTDGSNTDNNNTGNTTGGGNTDNTTGGGNTTAPVAFPGGIIGVKADATGKKDGTSWTDAYTDLQDAIAAAMVPGNTIQQIWVAKGTYKPAGPGGKTSEYFTLVDNVTIYGGFAGTEQGVPDRNITANETILSGDLNGDDTPGGGNITDNSDAVVQDSTTTLPTAILDGFTITAARFGGMRIVS